MPLSSGDKLGPYQISSPLGKGGMGEVYCARDSRLNRDVAIKVSAEQFAERFEREAHAVAALNHPNICSLYDVGPNYLVMELIEGPTLADRIKDGPISLEEALSIARQIADALGAAHEKGIVHRDLKPGNVKIKPDGTVKVLDFGLAKMGGTPTAQSEDSPTIAMGSTQAGVILGTAAYMSPEQARGKAVDKRADIWAFGVVLHEMLTGKRAFEGEDLADTLASVVKSDPNLTLVPPGVRKLLAKCLQKDPKKRLRDIGDAWDFLEETAGTPSLPRPRRTAWAVATGVSTFIAAALAFVHFREKPAEAPLARFSIEAPEKGSFAPTPPAISPDGRKLVFSAQSPDGKTQLWLRSLDSLKAEPLSGTEGALEPFWSPDSKSIAFFANNKLMRIDGPGAPVLALSDAIFPLNGPAGGTWSADGVILFAGSTVEPIRRVPASGGAGVPVTKLDSAKETAHRFPWFLPDGRHFLFFAPSQPGRGSIRIGSLDSPATQTLTDADSNAVYAQEHVLFLRGGTLMAQAFDAKALKLSGEPAPVAEQVRSSTTFPVNAAFSVSAKGDLVYATGPAVNLQLTWFDRSGKRIGTLGEPGDVTRVFFSPDRKSLTVDIIDPSSHIPDIWIYDVARGLRTRFTFDPSTKTDAIWSPDGGTAVFNSARKGQLDLYRKKSDGSGGEELLYADNLGKLPTSWSPDGMFLLYYTNNAPKTGFDVWVLPNPLGPPGASKPYPLVQTQFVERNAQFSPDGRWVAYESNESGQYEIYATPFPGPGGKRQISTSSGHYPRWSKDGKNIFYTTDAGRLTAAQIAGSGNTLEVGEITPLFGALRIGQGYQYDVSADGQHFLAIVPPEQGGATPLTLVQNWTAALKK